MSRGHRIVLAEDHTILREGLRAIFAGEPEFEVVGEATDGREAIQRAQETRPDLVLLDLSMPRTNGLDALQAIKKSNPATRVLVLTVHKTEEYVSAALQAGADGYVLKDSSATELLRAVRSVLSGERYLCPPIANQVVAGCLGPKAGSAFELLSAREREVLKLIAEGYRNREIGDYLCISPKTVEKHRASLMVKLNLHTVSALTTYAIDRGIMTR